MYSQQVLLCDVFTAGIVWCISSRYCVMYSQQVLLCDVFTAGTVWCIHSRYCCVMYSQQVLLCDVFPAGIVVWCISSSYCVMYSQQVSCDRLIAETVWGTYRYRQHEAVCDDQGDNEAFEIQMLRNVIHQSSESTPLWKQSKHNKTSFQQNLYGRQHLRQTACHLQSLHTRWKCSKTHE